MKKRRTIKQEYDVCECGSRKLFQSKVCKKCWIESVRKLAERRSTTCGCGRSKHHQSVECHACRKERIINLKSTTHKFDTCKCGKIKRADVKQCRECFFIEKKNRVRICRGCGIVLTPELCYVSSWRNGARTCKKCERVAAKGRNDGYKDRRREEGQILKREVMDAYGSKCTCCGEINIAFLSIDHIHNDGATHRNQMAGTGFYKWLKNNGFPQDDFQCLCMNCNFAKSANPGGCPHEIARQQAAEAQQVV